MTATKRRKVEKKEEKQPAPLLTEITKQEVLAKLGKPVDLHSINIHRHDASHCRVNVRRNLNKTAAEEHLHSQGVKQIDLDKMIQGIDYSISGTMVLITDSFYLRTNYDGSLRSDNKPIQRKY